MGGGGGGVLGGARGEGAACRMASEQWGKARRVLQVRCVLAGGRRVVDGGVEEGADDICDRDVAGGAAIVVRAARVSAAGEELAHDVGVALLAGSVQARPAICSRSFNVGAPGEKLAHDVEVTDAAGQV